MIKQVTVIGAGTMGNGIAHVFAQAGYAVNLYDISDAAIEKGLLTIQKNMQRQIEKGSLTEQQKTDALARIVKHTNLQAAVEHTDFVVEAATENQEIKLKLFKDMDGYAPKHCIFASNTSSISITKIAAATTRPELVIGMHYMNPVPVMKLIEVIRGYSTNDEVFNLTMELSKELGKIPIEVNDLPGFLANRILIPMINECVFALQERTAGVYEIDTMMRLGMHHPMGPLQLADFIGLDVCVAILDVLHEGFGNPKYTACPLLVKMVTAGKLGVKSGEGFYKYTSGSKEAVVSDKFINW